MKASEVYKWKKESEVTQSCLTLCDPMDCGPPGSSIHRIFQARVLEWVAISFSRGSSQPRDWTQVPCILGRRFTVWATREVSEVYPSFLFQCLTDKRYKIQRKQESTTGNEEEVYMVHTSSESPSQFSCIVGRFFTIWAKGKSGNSSKPPHILSISCIPGTTCCQS